MKFRGVRIAASFFLCVFMLNFFYLASGFSETQYLIPQSDEEKVLTIMLDNESSQSQGFNKDFPMSEFSADIGSFMKYPDRVVMRLKPNSVDRKLFIRDGVVEMVELNKEYIVQFAKQPLVKKGVREKEGFKEEASGDYGIKTAGAGKVSTRSELESEHRLAVEDIVARIRASELSLSPPDEMSFFEKIGFVLKRIFKRVTGFAVSDAEGIDIKKEFFSVFNGAVVRVEQKNLPALLSSPYVRAVYPNAKVKAFLNESIGLIKANEVWSMLDANGLNITGKGIKIAIVDTGVDYTHQSLGGCFGDGCKVAGGYDIVNNDNDPIDDQGHGTHVASTAAGNGVLKGVAPDATIYAYKVLDAGGSGTMEGVIAGIERAVDPNQDGDFPDRADIISMSLGGGGDPDDPVSAASDAAVDAGVVVVVAAGNSGPRNQTIGSPGVARKVITVGAIDKNNQLAEFSSRGPVVWKNGVLLKPDVSAPGVDICAAQFDGWLEEERECNPKLDQHIAISGTSMATPHVSGVVALLLQKNKSFSVEEIKNILMLSADDLGYGLNEQGMGKVNAVSALSAEFVLSGNADFGMMEKGQTNVEKKLRIKNLANGEISLSFSASDAISMSGEQLSGVISFSESSLTLGVGEEREVVIGLNFSLTEDGFFSGKIKINDGAKEYAMPYSFSRYSRITLKVDGNHFPNFFLHDDSLTKIARASQGWDFIGNAVTFAVESGNYTVNAINDFISPDDPGFGESEEYILQARVSVPVDVEVNKTFYLSEEKKFLIKARSKAGKPLNLYEWHKGLATYKDRFISGESISTNYYDPLKGDREIYLSNKPDNGLHTDITLKYVGAENE